MTDFAAALPNPDCSLDLAWLLEYNAWTMTAGACLQIDVASPYLPGGLLVDAERYPAQVRWPGADGVNDFDRAQAPKVVLENRDRK
jgi:hypothetical protein